jgi:hypothetical protein
MTAMGDGLEDRDDGSGYFSVLPTPPALIGGLTILGEAAILARRIPGNYPQAVAIEAIIAATERNVAEAGIAAVKASEEAAVQRLKTTRLRPRAPSFSGRDAAFRGGSRSVLEEHVRSEVIGLGSVGIGSIEELDTVVGSDGRPFWRTQEHGSSHNVGRVVFGLFQPGGKPANASEFRVHPIFFAGPGAPMRIRRPIPAKHFLRAGVAAAQVLRDREFGSTEAVAVDEMRAVRATLV